MQHPHLKLWITVCMALAVLLVTQNSFAYKVGDNLSPAVRQSLNIEGQSLVVVDFFASWCTSCRKELPLLNTLKLPASVHLVGICTDEELKLGEAFVKEMGLQFAVVQDPQQTLVEAFGPIGMPALYLIQDGQVKQIINGAIDHVDEKILRWVEQQTGQKTL